MGMITRRPYDNFVYAIEMIASPWGGFLVARSEIVPLIIFAAAKWELFPSGSTGGANILRADNACWSELPLRLKDGRLRLRAHAHSRRVRVHRGAAQCGARCGPGAGDPRGPLAGLIESCG